MIYQYSVDCKPINWLFGDGYTIFYYMCGWGGNEIHVQANKPVRNECLDIINTIGGLWWTTIEPENKMAINLCLRCGFEFFTQKTVIDGFDGKLVTMNIYKRHEDVQFR